MKVVYVKGMSLPKNCGECVFNRYRMMGKGKCKTRKRQKISSDFAVER